ncbi:hypothetical protein [Streptomyces sp. NPDC127112]
MFPGGAQSDVRGGHGGAAKAGKWTYTPVPAGSAPEQGATLRCECEGLEVDLQYSSSVLEDFLDVVGRIQTEFNRRSQEAARFRTAADECSGRMFRE